MIEVCGRSPGRRGLRQGGVVAAILVAGIAGLLGGLRPARAQEPDEALERRSVVTEVSVEGNRRAEAEAVRGVLRSRAGAPLDERTVSEDLRRVYSLGYFDDIRVELRTVADGHRLVFVVQEKPAIREIRYEGLDELSEDDLKEVVNLRQFSVLDVAEVTRNQQKIKDLYTEKGYFLAEVGYRLQRFSAHEVDVVFLVNEHAKVRVQKISFLGNKAIKDDEIKENIATREQSFHSFLSQAGNFKQELFDQDLLRIQAFYMNRGYVNVKVAEPVVTLSPDKEHIYITISIQEGEQYKIGGIELSGDLMDNEADLRKMLTFESGEIFDRGKLFENMERLANWYKDKGYAHANVNPLTKTNDETRIIDLNLQVQKGSLVHFGRIRMVGNDKTRDKVLRRELRIYEGDLYSESAIQLSKRNVTRLGFFETVEITTQRGASDDLMDVQVEIKERQTGTFQVGAGLSSMESIIGTAQISQTNLLGRGQSLSLQATLSSIRQYFNLHFGEPRFLDTNWLFSFDIFHYEYDYGDIVQGSTGGSLTLGYQLTDDLQVSFTYENALMNFERSGRPWESESGRTSSIKGMISYDTRNDRWLPSSGIWTYATQEIADDWLLSENEFSRSVFSVRYYQRLLWKLVAMARAEYGLVRPLGTRAIPEFERFCPGGIQSVRGFQLRSLCDYQWRSGSNADDPLVAVKVGGTEQVTLNFELTFPIFQQVGIQGVIFTDAGWGYQTDTTILADPERLWNGLKASWGFGFRWFSPIGPLRFEWGFPYNPEPGVTYSPFEFTIGNF